MSGSRRIEPLDAPPEATVEVPGSKSITNRALVAASLAAGTSTLDGALLADDTGAMIEALRALGIAIDVERDIEPTDPARGRDVASMIVHGAGGPPPAATARLDARLSGTTARFVLPLLALCDGEHHLDGLAPLRARPMADGIDALRALGVHVDEDGTPGHLPLTVTGPVTGDQVVLAGDVSSQFASGLLLAAPCFPRGLDLRMDGPVVSRPYLDLTVETMASFGVPVDRASATRFVVPRSRYRAERVTIEPDASAASYFFAAAVICGGRVRVPGLGHGSHQGDLGFVDVLERMGAQVTRGDDYTEVSAGATLHGVEADLADLSDTAQTLAVCAAFADSPTAITGVGFIRHKETDRIGALVRELRRCGVDAQELDDGLVVMPSVPHAATIETYDDHRMAMSFALVGLRVPGIRIADPGCVAKTFPGFFDALDALRIHARAEDG